MASGKDFLNIKTNHEGRANLHYLETMDRRALAFMRAYNWALTNDLYEMVKDGIPQGQKYGSLIKSLKLGELTGPKGSTFAVFIDSQSKHLKQMDAQRTVIYVRKRQVPTRVKPEIQILIDKGPWTMETIPFWPSKKDALIIQRKTDTRTADKITRLQKGQKDVIRRDLAKLNIKSVDQATKQKMMGGRKVKAVTDVANEMTTLEFGGGKKTFLANWTGQEYKDFRKAHLDGKIPDIETLKKRVEELGRIHNEHLSGLQVQVREAEQHACSLQGDIQRAAVCLEEKERHLEEKQKEHALTQDLLSKIQKIPVPNGLGLGMKKEMSQRSAAYSKYMSRKGGHK